MQAAQFVQEIQYALAPAILISSSALLLLGFQNKFSALVNRFRALNQERRVILRNPKCSDQENKRLLNLTEQVDHLMLRATHVKNAILLTYAAIVSFVGTSIFIFAGIYTKASFLSLAVVVFAIGLILIFVTSILMMIEIGLAFHIVTIERKSV